MDPSKFNPFTRKKIESLNQTNEKIKDDVNCKAKALMCESEYEIVKLKGAQIVRMQKLETRDAIIILVSAALAVGFQFLASMFSTLWISMLLLLFFYTLCLASCLCLYKVMKMTKLMSFTEISYFLGGGRGSIFLVSIILIIFYTTLPCQYIIAINLSILQFFPEGQDQPSYTITSYNYGILILGIILFPLSLIRDFKKIKILGYLILLVDSLVIVSLCFLIAIEDKQKVKQEFTFFGLKTPFNYLSEYCILFEIQIFYMWTMQSINQKTRKQQGKNIFIIAASSILVFSIIYSIFAYFAYNVNTVGPAVEIKFEEILTFFKQYPAGKAYLILNIISVVLVFPFKFYIGKEFVFVLYDECTNRSLSQKIDQLKKFTSTKGVYTKEMVHKVRDDIYQIVRQPYLKYSNKKYYLITILIYVPNVLFSLSYFQVSSNIREAMVFNSTIKLLKTPALPFMMFFLPGYFYYRSCIYFQLETKSRFAGLALAMIGISLMVLIFAFGIYSSIFIFGSTYSQ